MKLCKWFRQWREWVLEKEKENEEYLLTQVTCILQEGHTPSYSAKLCIDYVRLHDKEHNLW